MKNAVTRAYQLADNKPVELKRDGGKIFLNVARPIVDPMATVVVVEIEGTSVQR